MLLTRTSLFTSLILFLFFVSFQTTYGRPLAAQQPTSTLEWLTVDLWPDYDRAEVLVLLTGGLPEDVPLPATVTLPLPQQADLNAVARISDENQMIDDIGFERGDDTVTLTTPDHRFRVEYYVPYNSQGLQRNFTFNWPGGPAVSQFEVSVQQPSAAMSISVEPTADSVVSGNDGLQYHNLAVRQLGENEGFQADVSYTMSADQLTSAVQTAGPAGASAPADTTSGDFLSDVNWPPVLAGLGIALLLLAIGWQVFAARIATRQKPRKPRPLRAMRQSDAKYCHQCGAPAQANDRFCRECGTELKRT